MSLLKTIGIVAMGVILASGLSSCREDELGRPLTYQKGIYGGVQDEPLPDGTVRELQQRARYQSQ